MTNYLQKNYGLFLGTLYCDERVVVSLREKPLNQVRRNTEQYEVILCRSEDYDYCYLALAGLPQGTRLRTFLERKMYTGHVILHRAIAAFFIEENETLHGKEVHHINGYSLDNRFFNLQVLTPDEHNAIHQGKRARKKSAKGDIENELLLYLVVEYSHDPSPEYISFITKDNRSVSNSDQLPICAIFGGPRRNTKISLERADILRLGVLNKSAAHMSLLLSVFKGRLKVLTLQEIRGSCCDKIHHMRTIYRILDKLIAMRLIVRVSSGRYRATKHSMKKKKRSKRGGN